MYQRCTHHISCYIIHLILINILIIHLDYRRGDIRISCANKFLMPRICTLVDCHILIVAYFLLDKIEFYEPQ